jgi:hypothetical protein
MTVVQHASDAAYDLKNCSLCNKKLFYPYVEWHAVNPIAICVECCAKCRGLTLDLIHVEAISKMQAIAGPNIVLKHMSRTDYARKCEQEQAEIKRLDDAN